MSRSRVEDKGAQALALYLKSYDTLEYLEIYQNAIRDDGAVQLAESLLPSAKSGALKHLEINDNFFNNEDSLQALCALIVDSVALTHLNIDSSNIDDDDKARQILDAMVECQSKQTLTKFCWNYDAFELDEAIIELLGILEGQYPMLEFIELTETIDDKKKRNELRA